MIKQMDNERESIPIEIPRAAKMAAYVREFPGRREPEKGEIDL